MTTRPIALAEAWQCFATHAEPTSSEILSLTEAHHRVLCAPLIAKRAHPHTGIAAMDGYGFASSDTPSTKTLIGIASAGTPFPDEVGPKDCVRILTGADIPRGVTTVAMQEECTVSAGAVRLPASGEGKFIRHRGGDFDVGTLVCPAGIPLSSRDIAVGLAAGYESVAVYRPIRIAILATGSELSEPGSSEGTINSNMYALSALLGAAGGHIVSTNLCADDPASLQATILQNTDADLLILSGGVSVGDRDYVRHCLEAVAAEIVFHGVAMKPGKPSLYARFANTHILGLPGNPVSAQVCAELLAKPLLSRLQGRENFTPVFRTALCTVALPKGLVRENYLRGRCSSTDDGTCEVRLMDNQDSAALLNLAQGNCLIKIGLGVPERPANSPCEILPLDS